MASAVLSRRRLAPLTGASLRDTACCSSFTEALSISGMALPPLAAGTVPPCARGRCGADAAEPLLAAGDDVEDAACWSATLGVLSPYAPGRSPSFECVLVGRPADIAQSALNAGNPMFSSGGMVASGHYIAGLANAGSEGLMRSLCRL